MNPLMDFNEALNLLEENLDQEIDDKQLALKAHCSEHHFRRLFSYLAGFSLSEYIRRRRMSLAGLELQTGRARVVDLAIKYGYSSADSFSRAFQDVHGLLPSQAREPGVAIRVFPRMTFQLTLKGGRPMKVRLIEKPSFKVVGFRKEVPLIYRGVHPEIAKMWEALTENDIGQLKELSNQEPRGIISATVHLSESYEEGAPLEHYIGVASTKQATGGYSVLPVDAATWAVFETLGPFPETLQDTWARIYSEWLPSSPYELIPGPNLLWNETKDIDSPNFRSEIWIPVTAR